MNKDQGSILLGMAVCWLLNLVELGVAFLLLAASEKLLPFVYALVGAIGLVQVGYVVPLWRFLRRKGRPRAARGVLLAAAITALLNVALVHHFFGFTWFHPPY